MKRVTLVLATFALIQFTKAQKQDSKVVSTTTTQATPVKTVQEPKDVNKAFEFKNADYDFGKIPFGKPAEYELSIKNITKDTAVLDNVQVSCGCTTPKYEKGKKFLPGETIKVGIGFNGSAHGQFARTVTIFLNNNAYTKPITFKGETFEVAAPAPANNATDKLKPAGE